MGAPSSTWLDQRADDLTSAGGSANFGNCDLTGAKHVELNLRTRHLSKSCYPVLAAANRASTMSRRRVRCALQPPYHLNQVTDQLDVVPRPQSDVGTTGPWYSARRSVEA